MDYTESIGYATSRSMANILVQLIGKLSIMSPTPNNLPRTSQECTCKMEKCPTLTMWYHSLPMYPSMRHGIIRIRFEGDRNLKHACTLQSMISWIFSNSYVQRLILCAPRTSLPPTWPTIWNSRGAARFQRLSQNLHGVLRTKKAIPSAPID